MKTMTAEIIAIGTEILLGDIVNTNAAYLARELAQLGINTYHQEVVGDNPERVLETFKHAFERANLVITSGGLGPTQDDLSKEMGAKFFGVPLKEDSKARAHIEGYMQRLGRSITENNWKQAMLPEGSLPLYNNNGTAPGFILNRDERILIMLPGPPSELIPMFADQVIPYLRALSEDVLISRTLHICGTGESAVESILQEQMRKMTNPTLAPYAKEGTVDLRITAKAKSEEVAREMIAPVEEEIREIFGQQVFGADADTLESVVVELLAARGWHVATAESCTAGWASGRIVNYPGASKVLEGGLVTYSNEAKMALLRVKKETLDQYGAVSVQTAAEMAEGAAKILGTETAVSITGIAGPGGGTDEKPVGTVCVGVFCQGKIKTERFQFSRNREANRRLSVVKALDMLRLIILEN